MLLRDGDEARLIDGAALWSDPILFVAECTGVLVTPPHPPQQQGMSLAQKIRGKRPLLERIRSEAEGHAIVEHFFGIVALGLVDVAIGSGLDFQHLSHGDVRALDLR